LYLEFGSIGALKEELDRRGFRTKRKVLSTGRSRGGDTFIMSGLNHLLQNRFYIGEIFYRDQIYAGDHEPILDRSTFDAVQAKLAANNVAKKISIREKPAILSGRIYDDRGNRMTPSHANKSGVRYRYYVSTAILQRRKAEAGTISRVSAPEVEKLVLQELRKRHPKDDVDDELGAREVVEALTERIVIKPKTIEILLIERARISESVEGEKGGGKIITIDWAAPSLVALKGELHTPSDRSSLKPEARDAILSSIVKARGWIKELSEGQLTSFQDIAEREGKCERHIRLLAPLAFVAPSTLSSIVNQTAEPSMTVTGLARRQNPKWKPLGSVEYPDQ
jgi:site-specific DNA recombinase